MIKTVIDSHIPKTIVYLHGFRSGPQSIKAKQFKAALENIGYQGTLWVPDLGFDIRNAINMLQKRLMGCLGPYAFVGSSLGGYYATYLAERLKCVQNQSVPAKVVLINPSVRPYELLKNYLGWVENIYTTDKFEVKQEYISILKEYDVAQVSQVERYLLLSKTNDEVLDYWQAVEKYRGCHAFIAAGGNHAYEDFAEYLPRILKFLNINGMPVCE